MATEKEKDYEKINVREAKKSLKYHITLLESLLRHIRNKKEPHYSRSIFASWCIHQYMEHGLIKDIEKVVEESFKTINDQSH